MLSLNTFDNMRQQNGGHVASYRRANNTHISSVEGAVWQRISPPFLCVCWRLTPRSLPLSIRPSLPHKVKIPDVTLAVAML